jgi:hypothetical protein
MLVRGRRLAEELMTDSCVAGTEVRSSQANQTTGKYELVFTALYTGPCQFKAGTTGVGEIDAQGQLLIEQDSVIKFPIATSGMLGKNHVVYMTGSETDPALIGVKARIKGPFTASSTTARRFAVEVTT